MDLKKHLKKRMYVHFVMGYIIYNLVQVVNGHGRLMEPPSRSSMWRLGYNTPHNYQDNELFCGGFQVNFTLLTKDLTW